MFKFIGAALGAYFLRGFFGAIIGYLLGSFVDSMVSGKVTVGTAGGSGQGSPWGRGGYQDPFGQQRQSSIVKDFNAALVVLSAAVMKADGKVKKSELGFVKNFFRQQFGEQAAKEYLLLLQDTLKKDIPVQQVAQQISGYMQMEMRLQLLQYLYGIAKADGNVHSTEAEVIERIAAYMRISKREFESIKAMFYEEVGSAYKILEVAETATDSEVKKAYRRMAIKYHPDKVAQLGPEVQKGAKEKFQKVQDAYEKIRKERGMV